MCLVRGLKFVSVVAKTIQVLLSSWTFKGGSCDWNVAQEMESKDPCGIWTNEKVVMSFKIQRSGRISLVVEDRVMYSLSVVERVISDLEHSLELPCSIHK